MDNILVTGGAGYIGSHTCLALLAAGHNVVIYDNFYNSKANVLARLQRIAFGAAPTAEMVSRLTMVEGDIRNKAKILETLKAHSCTAVMHFAGLKAVGESVQQPLRYYDNNVQGTLCLLRAMSQADVWTLVFSSSATVYGQPEQLPVPESHPLTATNPYGRSKLMIEDMLRDLHHAEPNWRMAILRYFNPVGAHESAIIGEDPNGIPNNLFPFITQVAVGLQPHLRVWGNDYDTPDGTGVRDYIHVQDLADGHLKALTELTNSSMLTLNLGTGKGYSVLEVVKAFEAASGVSIPLQVMPRRPGDATSCYADVRYAQHILDWKATRNLDQMCRDAWKWQQTHARMPK